MLIVLNKLDLLEGGAAALDKIKNKMKKTLEHTKFEGKASFRILSTTLERVNIRMHFRMAL